MAVPYELYIRFLASKGLNELQGVNEALAMLYLPPVSQKDLEGQLATLDAVLPAGISRQLETKAYGPDLLQWMAVCDIKELWQNEKAFQDPETKTKLKLIYDIHNDTALRRTLNALIIKAMKPKEIAQILQAKFASLLKEDHVDLYSKVFFNPSRMARADWRDFIKTLADTEARAYVTALSEPLDVLKTELELPAKVSVSETLQWLLAKSYGKARTYMEINTPEANHEARAWIDQVVKLSEKYEKYRSGDTDDFSKSLQMEFQFIDAPFDEPGDDIMLEVAERLKAKKITDDSLLEAGSGREKNPPAEGAE